MGSEECPQGLLPSRVTLRFSEWNRKPSTYLMLQNPILPLMWTIFSLIESIAAPTFWTAWNGMLSWSWYISKRLARRMCPCCALQKNQHHEWYAAILKITNFDDAYCMHTACILHFSCLLACPPPPRTANRKSSTQKGGAISSRGFIPVTDRLDSEQRTGKKRPDTSEIRELFDRKEEDSMSA